MPTAPVKVAAPANPTDQGQARQFANSVALLLNRAAIKSPAGYLVIDATTKVAWQSPNGHYWGITIDNSGAFMSTDLGTTAP